MLSFVTIFLSATLIVKLDQKKFWKLVLVVKCVHSSSATACGCSLSFWGDYLDDIQVILLLRVTYVTLYVAFPQVNWIILWYVGYHGILHLWTRNFSTCCKSVKTRLGIPIFWVAWWNRTVTLANFLWLTCIFIHTKHAMGWTQLIVYACCG